MLIGESINGGPVCSAWHMHDGQACAMAAYVCVQSGRASHVFL